MVRRLKPNMPSDAAKKGKKKKWHKDDSPSDPRKADWD